VRCERPGHYQNGRWCLAVARRRSLHLLMRVQSGSKFGDDNEDKWAPGDPRALRKSSAAGQGNKEVMSLE
jgi:hypothetical protein